MPGVWGVFVLVITREENQRNIPVYDSLNLKVVEGE
jgi:hypothetical protein